MQPAPTDASLLALDPRGLAALRRGARDDTPGALRGVAREFESLFLGMMLKSMRATASGGPFDNDATRLYRELADQQMARAFATTGKGVGLADMLLAQMQRKAEGTPAPESGPIPLKREPRPHALAGPQAAIPLKAKLPGSDMMPLANAPKAPAGMRDFVSAVWPHAVRAGRELGVPPAFLVAQAALESGWGQREIRLPDGRPSHNLFGIKAGPDWQGPAVEVATTEYVNGRAESRQARFRAYASYAEAFADHARLLQRSARYEAALGATDFTTFAAALQRAGYATDPAYADKLGRVMASRAFQEAMAA